MARKKNFFFYKKFYNKLMNFLVKSGQKAKAYSFYLNLIKNMFLVNKVSFLQILTVLLKKDKIPFRLLGIRRRGKIVGLPISLRYTSQYYDCFRNLVLFSKKAQNINQFDYIYSFLTENNKFINKDLYSKKLVNYKLASASARLSPFTSARYR